MELVKYLNKKLNLGIQKIPCAATIAGWVLKSGYKIYHSPMADSSDYSLIVDESMMVGSQKLMLSLAIPSHKQTGIALRKIQTHVLGLCVSDKWNGEKISEFLKENAHKAGRSPLYVITDNDTKMNKGVRLSGYTHIRDINHTLGMFFSRIYKEDKEFMGLLKNLSKIKSRQIMSSSCYLLPPHQRSIARYLNLYPLIGWAQRMLKNFTALTEQEKKTFGFIHTYSLLIKELHLLLDFSQYVLKEIRLKGLSKKSISQILSQIKLRLSLENTRIKRFKNYLIGYLKEEKDKVKTKEVWNGSSDIIESFFGFYKARKATNPLAGITNYILTLPLIASFDTDKQALQINIKEALEQVYIKDLVQFKKDNLPESMMIKRRKKLTA